MFEALRKNFQNVQEGISAGLQKLSTNDRTPSSPSEPKVGTSAGSDLLDMYQSQWATMHHMAESNSKAAEVVDQKISKLVEEYESQYSQVAEIHSLLAHLPNIMSQLHSSLATIGSIRGLFEEVEGELLKLEDLQEESIVQDQILDMKLSLALKREKSFHEYSQLKKELQSMHQVKTDKILKETEAKRRENEEILTNKFQQDMKEYQMGKLSKNSTAPSVQKLEDVELEQDNELLDSFLNE